MSPRFQEIQHRFTAFLRDPEGNPPPGDVDPRRMQVYRDLFYDNIAGFLAQGFPVAHRILAEKELWHPLVRSFFATCSCKNPYFSGIPGEFVAWLSKLDAASSPFPPYLAELAHYEWLEVVLDDAVEEIADETIDPAGDLLRAPPVLNPVHRIAQYRWPVSSIGSDCVPSAPLAEPLLLLLFRNRAFRVRFVEINPLTHRLIRQLTDNPALTGELHLRALSRAMPQMDQREFLRFGAELLEDFRQREFILGTARQDMGGERRTAAI